MKKACSYCGKMMQDVEVPKIGATPFFSCNLSKVTPLDKKVFPRRALQTLKVLSPLTCLSSKCRRAELFMYLMTTLPLLKPLISPAFTLVEEVVAAQMGSTTPSENYHF